LKVKSCEFVRAAAGPEAEPAPLSVEFVFLGRSNVGKSALINRLCGVKGLARTSSTPGRTQHVHFYRINQNCHFIDLPGYGYARVPERIRRSWGPMVESFLERRRAQITLAILVVDARHEPTRLDRVMQQWLKAREIEYVVTATKTDKLSGNGKSRAEKLWRRATAEDEADLVLVSARSGLGIKELWRRIDRAAEARTGNRRAPR